MPGSQKTASAANSNSYLESRLVDESFSLAIQYGDEYMDENPITGHPGAFNLSSTGRSKEMANQLLKMAAENQAKAAAAAKPDELPPTRKGIKADKSTRSGMPKIKRKKSKGPNAAGGTTPVTPVTPK